MDSIYVPESCWFSDILLVSQTSFLGRVFWEFSQLTQDISISLAEIPLSFFGTQLHKSIWRFGFFLSCYEFSNSSGDELGDIFLNLEYFQK